MFKLKPLHKEGISAALAKADKYRLLADPTTAESICLDVLQLEPGNQLALVTLLLALTDQFGKISGVSITQAREILPRLTEEYHRFYYDGVIRERWAKSVLLQGRNKPDTGYIAYDQLR